MKKKHLLASGLVAIGLATAATALGIPAKSGLRTLTGADGQPVTVRIVGDEFFSQYYTVDGYPLTIVDGNYYYCDYSENGELRNSGIIAGEKETRNAEARAFLAGVDTKTLPARLQKYADAQPRRSHVDMEHFIPAEKPRMKAPGAGAMGGNDGPPYPKGYGLFPDLRFPAYGQQKSIVILVEYQDVKFTLSDPFDYFNRMLNEEGFSDYRGTGCANEFFRLNSVGTFDCQFDVYGPVTLSKNRKYYGEQIGSTHDAHPADMVVEACRQLDPDVDFREYDRNGDGIIDNVFVFYAGQGQASYGPSESVWPHAWNVEAAGYSNLKFDGVRLRTYGCSNEWEAGRPDGVGTFVHEFSHVMGVPDLYATSYTSSFTPGSWSCMDVGPYNNGGCTPPLYGAFERYALGWMAPREVEFGAKATLEPIIENVAGVIRTPSDTEFFLIENRQQTGWDKYIPGHGMLVWHIDYNSGVWSSNRVNNTPAHQYVDIEEADNTQTESSRDGDSFPGRSKITEFTANMRPAMKTWGGVAIDKPLTEIREDGGNIYFTIMDGGSGVPSTQSYAPTEVNPDGFKMKWDAKDGFRHIVSIYTLREGSDPAEPGKNIHEKNRVYVPGYKNFDAGEASEHVFSTADPETTYYYTVKVSNGWEHSEETAEFSVTTGRRNLDYYPVIASEATDVEADSFNANWQPLTDANNYKLTVYTKAYGEPVIEEEGFKKGLSTPGWSGTVHGIYETDAYSGKSIPSIQFAGDEELVTPEYDNDISAVSFWTRGAVTTPEAVVEVYGFNGDEWILIASEPVIRTTGGKTSTITDIPEAVNRLKFVFKANGEKGILAFDDVIVSVLTSTEEPLSAYNDKEVGDVQTAAVTGLQPATRYFYKVRATDGTLVSKYSDEIRVTTKGTVGISQAIADKSVSISVAGRTISSEGNRIMVCDAAGRIIASGSGSLSVDMPGLYIVTLPDNGKTFKIVIK